MTLEQEMLRKAQQRDRQLRALCRQMRKDGRSEEYLDAMDHEDNSRLNVLLEEYGLMNKVEPAFG